jgi:hypothetical protein
MPERKVVGWKSCGLGCVAVLVVLGLLGAGCYSLVNRIPKAPQITAHLPNPNARDVYLRAKPLLPTNLPLYFRDIENLSEPQLTAIVRKGVPALRLLKSGLPLEYGAPPITSLQTLRPELKVYRDLVRLQIAEARLAERRGNVSAAARGYLSVLRVAVQLSNGIGVQDGNISIHMQRAALRGVERLTPYMSGDLAQNTLLKITTLERQILTIDETLKRKPLVNECISIDVMWIARSGSPQAKADLTPATVVFGYDPRYLLTPKKQMIGAQRRYYEALRAAASKPYWQRGPLPEEPHDPLNTTLLTPLEGSVFGFDTARACFQLVKVKLAVRAYVASFGRAPKQLEDLSPKFVSSIQDSFSGKALLLNWNPEGKPMVYSVGPDRDDDGGKPIKEAIRPDSDGDLIRVPDR